MAETLQGSKEAPLCFVVMGFGKKTDYESGRTLDLNATYEAIIKPSMGGSFADEGATDLSVFTFAGGDDVATSTGYVTEFFTSTLPTTRPLLPDAKEQCKDQGFLIFGVFENQGDCVSFVSTHGNNEPGRNNG